jgi:hypothetical protein
MEAYGGVEIELHSFLTLVIEENEWPNADSTILDKEPLFPWSRWLGGS